MTEQDYHWRPRDVAVARALVHREQVDLRLPGYRPDYGFCPGCRAPADRYCMLGCPLVDPHALKHLDLLARCRRCPHAETDAHPDGLGVLPGRRVVHRVRLADEWTGLCSSLVNPLVPLNGATW